MLKLFLHTLIFRMKISQKKFSRRNDTFGLLIGKVGVGKMGVGEMAPNRERDIKTFYLMPTMPYQEYENKIIQH